MRVQAEVSNASDVGGALAGVAETWCDVASLQGFGCIERFALGPQLDPFGHGLGTSAPPNPL
jgi:hypothetical protein